MKMMHRKGNMAEGYPSDVPAPVAGGEYVQQPEYIDQRGGGLQGYNYPPQKAGYGQQVPQSYGPGYTGVASVDRPRKKKNRAANTFAAAFVACWACTWPCHGPCCGGL